jgi:hypothetical protein
MKTALVSFLILACSACTDATDRDTGPAGDIASQPQFDTGSGKTDDATTHSTDARVLTCVLEYEAFTPSFAARPAATFSTTFGDVENTGAKAGDGAYTLSAHTNKHPPYNLSFVLQIVDEARKGGISYIVLPRPHVGGAFLFELGADIAPVSFPDTGEQMFDNLRAYCSIRNPS